MLYSDTPNSLHHFLTGEALKILESRVMAINQLQTRQDWQSRQSAVQELLWKMAGPFPEKSRLNAKITGTVKKNGYKIENVIYESLPGFYVTASLFVRDSDESLL